MLYCQNTPPVGHPTVYPEQEILMDDNTTPAEFVKLRDQLTLDLDAIVSHVANARRSAEYLLASGLVPLSTIRARYDETHPAPKGDAAETETETEPEPEVVQPPAIIEQGDDVSAIPVGTLYLDSDPSTARWRLRKTETGWAFQVARQGGSLFTPGMPSPAYYPLTLESAK